MRLLLGDINAVRKKIGHAVVLAPVLLLAILFTKGHLQQLYGAWNPLSDGAVAPAGTVDFYAYWAAFQAQKQGLNPYDPSALQRMRDFGGVSFAGIHYYWNPPWMLVLAAPVLNLPFESSASVWMGLSLLFSVVSALLIWMTQESHVESLGPSLIASLCFYPLLETLYWGQVGALLTLGVAGFVWAIWNRRDFLAGSFLILASLKPHLLYLFFLAVACWVVMERRYRVLLGAAAAGVALASLVWVLAPDSFQQWLGNSARSWEHITTRKSANLVGFSRGLIADFTGRAPVWPLVAIPATAAVVFLVSLLWFKRRIEWSRDLAPILCCSVFTAPYGWAHDHLVLSLVQIGAIGLATGPDSAKSAGRVICLYWLAFQLSVFGLSFTFQPAFQFFWFPLGIFLLWLVSSARLSSQPSPGRDNGRCGVRLGTARESNLI